MHNLFSRECHFFLSVFIYSFLAVVGLRCCVGFFSSYDKWGLLWSCSARVLIVVASRVALKMESLFLLKLEKDSSG